MHCIFRHLRPWSTAEFQSLTMVLELSRRWCQKSWSCQRHIGGVERRASSIHNPTIGSGNRLFRQAGAFIGLQGAPPCLPPKRIVDLRIFPLSWFHPKNKPFDIKGTRRGSGEHRRSWEWGKGHILSSWSVRKQSYLPPLSKTHSFQHSFPQQILVVYLCYEFF